MDAFIARGQPYQTVVYRNQAPVFSTVHAILTINGAPATSQTLPPAGRFVIVLNNNQKWVVYTSTPLKLTLMGASSLVASAPFTGVVRAAVATSPAALAALDMYRQVYTTDGHVAHKVGHVDSPWI